MSIGKKEMAMLKKIEEVELLVKSRTKQLEKGMTELTAALEKQLNEKRVAFVSVLDSLKERIVMLEKQAMHQRVHMAAYLKECAD